MLRIENLRKVFDESTINEKTIFNDFSLHVKKGQFVTIIGSNGAGKSTLLSLISGTLEVDDGKIVLNDNNIEKLSEYKRAPFIARVFQDPTKGTSPSLTILENMSLYHNKGKKFNLSKCVYNENIYFFRSELKKLNMGLEKHMNTKVGLLSGGQRQALSLLMAAMTKPKLLLLDEPTAALDPSASKIIVNLAEQLVREHNITTLMVTHNMKHAISIGDRLLMLHQGDLLLDISGEEKNNLSLEKVLDCFKDAKSNILSDGLFLS